jgi:hypothetical protein
MGCTWWAAASPPTAAFFSCSSISLALASIRPFFRSSTRNADSSGVGQNRSGVSLLLQKFKRGLGLSHTPAFMIKIEIVFKLIVHVDPESERASLQRVE